MSAGANAYSKNRLNGKDSEGNIKTTLPALFLTDYQNATKFKELFYCDEVWIQKDSENKSIINGLVEENGSNLSMRDVKRKGNLRIRKDNKNYVVLNDAGLNTYAYCKIEQTDIRWANYCKIKLIVNSAFYSPTREYGFDVDLLSAVGVKIGETERLLDSTDIIARKETEEKYYIVTKGTEEKQKLRIKPFTINDEGEKTIGEFIINLNDLIIFNQAIKIPNLSTKPTYDTQVNFFTTKEIFTRLGEVQKDSNWSGIDLNIYIDDAMTTVVPNGLYSVNLNFTGYGTYTGNQLGAYTDIYAVIEVANGEVISWHEGTWDVSYEVDYTYINVIGTRDLIILNNYTLSYNNTSNEDRDINVNINLYTASTDQYGIVTYTFDRTIDTILVQAKASTQDTITKDLINNNIYLRGNDYYIGAVGINTGEEIMFSNPNFIE